MRVLYEVELGKTKPADSLAFAEEDLKLDPAQAEYARRLVEGIRSGRHDLDRAIARHVRGYEFDRLAEIDRNLLRIAAYELLHIPEIPPAVSIDEAVAIAKRFSTAESGRFVNGVLGSLVRETPKARWDPATAPQETAQEAPAPCASAEVEEIAVSPDDDALRAARTVGGWKLGKPS